MWSLETRKSGEQEKHEGLPSKDVRNEGEKGQYERKEWEEERIKGKKPSEMANEWRCVDHRGGELEARRGEIRGFCLILLHTCILLDTL